MNPKIKKVCFFVVLTFVLSWGLVAVFFAAGGRWEQKEAMALAIVYMFIPMISAMIVQKIFFKEEIKTPLGIHFRWNRWLLAAWLLPFIFSFATIAVSLTFPSFKFAPGLEGLYTRLESMYSADQISRMKEFAAALPFHMFWVSLLQGLIAGVTVNAIAGFGEELGWRGFLQKELIGLGFWRSSWLIGIIWGIWHAPLILQGHNYPQHPRQGVAMMIVWCTLLAPVFTFIRLKADSVIAAAVLHGSLNASAGLSFMVIAGGNDLTTGVTGLPGFIVLILANLAIWKFGGLQVKQKKVNG